MIRKSSCVLCVLRVYSANRRDISIFFTDISYSQCITSPYSLLLKHGSRLYTVISSIINRLRAPLCSTCCDQPLNYLTSLTRTLLLAHPPFVIECLLLYLLLCLLYIWYIMFVSSHLSHRRHIRPTYTPKPTNLWSLYSLIKSSSMNEFNSSIFLILHTSAALTGPKISPENLLPESLNNVSSDFIFYY